MKLKIKKQNTILISLLALSLAACNGGGGGSSSSGGGDDPAPPNPPPPVVYPHNGLTMTTVAVKDGITKPVQLAKTFGHSQYYLVITNNNEETIKFNGVNFDGYFESTAITPYNPTGMYASFNRNDIVKYVMKYDGTAIIDNKTMPACLFTGESPTIYQIRKPDGIGVMDVAVSGTILAPGASCAYKLNAMWADNANKTKDTFNWKMSYFIMYGESNIANPLYCSDSYCENGFNAVKPLTCVGLNCQADFPNAPRATAAEIESADNNQNLSYYLPNHSNAIGSDVTTTYLASLSADNASTGGSNTPVTNMAGDILWVPSAIAYTGSVSRYQLNYNSSTNTLTKGSFLNSYVGGTDWLKGGASSNLTGDTFYQDNYANNINVEPLTVSAMIWHPGLDGSMYASSGNNAYGVLKVTPDGNGGYTETKLPYDFNTPTNNIVQAVAANGNILTQDYNSYANYCYVNNGNNSYTKTLMSTKAGSHLWGKILAGVNYVWGSSDTMNGGVTYLDFTGTALSSQPSIYTKMNSSDCSSDYSSYFVSGTGPVDMTNNYALIGVNGLVISRVANINTVSNGTDGN